MESKRDTKVRIKKKRLETLESEFNFKITSRTKKEYEKLDECLSFMYKFGADKSLLNPYLPAKIYSYLQYYPESSKSCGIDFKMIHTCLLDMIIGKTVDCNINARSLACIGAIWKNSIAEITEYKLFTKNLPNDVIHTCISRLSKELNQTSIENNEALKHLEYIEKENTVSEENMIILNAPEFNPLKMTFDEVDKISQSFALWSQSSRT